MRTSTIGISGAGTAGLACAIALARDGHRVDVFEKHPSLAALGAGVLIQPQGVAALERLGVGAAFRAVSVPIARLLGLSHRGWSLVDIQYPHLEARAVSRTALGGVLLAEAQRLGVRLHFGAAIDAVTSRAGRACTRVAGTEHAFDAFVIANGAASQLPEACGLAVRSSPYRWGALWGMFDLDEWPEPQLLAQRYHGTRQMYGIMPTERVDGRLRVSFFWSLPGDRFDAWRATPIAAWKQELLELWPESAALVAQIHAHDQFAFARYYHAKPARLAAPPICIVGDAAHAMSPQLGLGSTLAVQDALALSRCIAAHGAHDGLLRYSATRRLPVRAWQAFSWLLTPCFQADGNGWWRDLLFGAGLLVPGTRALMYRSLAARQ